MFTSYVQQHIHPRGTLNFDQYSSQRELAHVLPVNGRPVIHYSGHREEDPPNEEGSAAPGRRSRTPRLWLRGYRVLQPGIHETIRPTSRGLRREDPRGGPFHLQSGREDDSMIQ